MAKLLIVEDDDSVRMFVSRALERCGHQIEVAADGAQGLEMIKAAKGGYDLVLSDIRMPAMDGIEMAMSAAGLFPTLRLLLMTGYADQRERADDLSKVIVDVVNKPFSLAEIRSRVDAALSVDLTHAA
ncbi:response regulator [Aquamicrobium segne]|uniref:Response regulator n=1 Tax=Aquamicrobium segne TaxID=469547 RepID=A0ABW0H0X4_9HYPH